MSTSTKLVVDVGAVGIAGSLLGVPLQPLLLAAIAGGIMLGLAPVEESPRRVVAMATVLMSALLGGALGPLAAHYAGSAGWIVASNHVVAESLVAVAVGAGWPWAVSRLAPSLADGISGLITRVLGGKKQEPGA